MQTRCQSAAVAAFLIWVAFAASGAQAPAPRATPKAPASPRATHVEATVRPAAWQGKCPVTLHFTARVTVANPPAKVQYEWIRSDGAKSEPKEIFVRGTEGIIGGESWQLGGSKDKLTVWERVHVLTPNTVNSRDAAVRIACQ